MHKTNDWSSSTIQQLYNSTQHYTSESESAPLLSSGSHASMEPVIFHDSETSDLESNPTDGCPKYGSITTGILQSVTNIIPKKLPLLIQENTLGPPVLVKTSCPPSLSQNEYYQINNTDTVQKNEKYKANGTPNAIKGITNGFLHRSYSLEQEASQKIPKDDHPKQSSVVTVFSVWNTILGSSLLTMPWGIQMAGFIPSIILILIMSGLCLYTAYCLLAVHKYHGGQNGIEVIELSRIFLNKWAEYVAKIFSITVLLGATIAYWILMSNFLYNSINFFYDNIAAVPQYPVSDNVSYAMEVLCPGNTKYNGTNIIHEHTFDSLGPFWDLHKTVPVFLGLLIFPFLNFNSPTFFTKFNSLGTASIAYLIIFVIVKSASWGINMDRTEWDTIWILKPTFAALSGMLALSFFIHNIIITIMHNNHDQSKNGRDLSIAYILVTVTYLIVGVAFYICFPLKKSCIEDNFLNNFQKGDGLTVGARVVLLFQLLTVYPLLAYMLRVQLLSSVCTTLKKGWVVLVNIILVFICILFATFVPYIGTIIRYTGALSGFIYVFTFPSLLYLVILKKQGKLTLFTKILHTCIPILGISNLIAQFFVSDS